METKITESEVVEMEVELQVYDKVAVAVNEARARCNNIVLCYDTPKDIKESKSFIYQLRQLKAPIAQAHKEGKAEALKFTGAMDVMKNTLTAIVEVMIEEKYAPIKLLEDAAKKDAEEVEARGIQVEICEQDAKQAEFDAKQAELVAKEVELRTKQKELERKERDKAIAEDAARKAEEAAKQAVIRAENAKVAAEANAANEKLIAHAKIERERQIAEQRRIADVQRAKQEAIAAAEEKHRQVIEAQQAERIETARLEDQRRRVNEEREMAETARINDEKHRTAMHNAIYEGLKKIGFYPHDAKNFTQAIIDGKIPHTYIKY